MSVRQRGERWYYDFMVRGKRYRNVVADAVTKKHAQHAEREARRAVFEGRYEQFIGKSITLREFVDKFYYPYVRTNCKAKSSLFSHTKALVNDLGNVRLDHLSAIAIEGYKKRRAAMEIKLGRLCSPVTVNNEIGLLRRILNLAIDHGYLHANPARKVKKLRQPPQRTRYLTAEEEQRLMNVLTERLAYLKPIVQLVLRTGMRRGEVNGLQWEAIDLDRRLLTLTVTKSGRNRFIPLSKAAIELLATLQPRSSGPVFVDELGRQRKHNQFDWEDARRLAQLQNFRFHDLRHTCATRLAESGADPFTIAELLGHTNVQMTARYAHATGEGMRKAVESL